MDRNQDEVIRVTRLNAQTLRAYADNSLKRTEYELQHKVYGHEEATGRDTVTWMTEYHGTKRELDAYQAGIRRAAELLEGWSR